MTIPANTSQRYSLAEVFSVWNKSAQDILNTTLEGDPREKYKQPDHPQPIYHVELHPHESHKLGATPHDALVADSLSGLSLNSPPAPAPAPATTASALVPPSMIQWHYIDHNKVEQGPFSGDMMAEWWAGGFLNLDLNIRRKEDTAYMTIQDLCQATGNFSAPFLVPLAANTAPAVAPAAPPPAPPLASPLTADLNQAPTGGISAAGGTAKKDFSLLRGLYDPFAPSPASPLNSPLTQQATPLYHQLPLMALASLALPLLGAAGGALGSAPLAPPTGGGLFASQLGLASFQQPLVNPQPFAPQPTATAPAFLSRTSSSWLDFNNASPWGVTNSLSLRVNLPFMNGDDVAAPSTDVLDNFGVASVLNDDDHKLFGGPAPTLQQQAQQLHQSLQQQSLRKEREDVRLTPSPRVASSGASASILVASPSPSPVTTTAAPTTTATQQYAQPEPVAAPVAPVVPVETPASVDTATAKKLKRKSEQPKEEAAKSTAKLKEVVTPKEPAPKPQKLQLDELIKPKDTTKTEAELGAACPWLTAPQAPQKPVLTLKEIQQLEAEKQSKQKQQELQIRAEQAQRAWAAAEAKARVPDTQANIDFASKGGWGTAPVAQQPPAKTLAEIQREEAELAAQKRAAQKAASLSLVPLFALAAAAALLAIPDLAWTTVALKKPATKKPAVPQAPAITNQPSLMPSPQVLRMVSAAPKPVLLTLNLATREEFMVWARSQMAGLYPLVLKEELLAMFCTLLTSLPDSQALIAETMYASLATVDGRRFAQEFLKRRGRVDAKIGMLDEVEWAAAIAQSADKVQTVDEDGWLTTNKKKGKKKH